MTGLSCKRLLGACPSATRCRWRAHCFVAQTGLHPQSSPPSSRDDSKGGANASPAFSSMSVADQSVLSHAPQLDVRDLMAHMELIPPSELQVRRSGCSSLQRGPPPNVVVVLSHHHRWCACWGSAGLARCTFAGGTAVMWL